MISSPNRGSASAGPQPQLRTAQHPVRSAFDNLVLAAIGLLVAFLAPSFGWPAVMWAGYAIAAVGVLLALDSIGLNLLFIRLIRAGTPVSVAWRVAARWSLVMEESHVYGTHGKKHVYPAIVGFSASPAGPIIHVKMPSGAMTPTDLVRQVEEVSAGLRCPVEIVETGPATADVTLLTKNPYENLRPLDHPNAPDLATFAVEVGVTSRGTPMVVTPAGAAGVLVTGVPGSGKTVLAQHVLASWAGVGAEIYISDFKGSSDWDAFDGTAKVLIKDDLDATAEMLSEVRSIMETRLQTMKSAYGVTNFWNIPAAQRPPLLVVLIDEIQELLDQQGMSRDEKQIAGQATRDLTSLVKRGRSAGVVVVAVTQKSDATAIPTKVRDVMAVRISGRQLTREGSVASLGAVPETGDLPHEIPAGSAGVGRMVAATDSGVLTQFQAYYLPEASLDEHLRGVSND